MRRRTISTTNKSRNLYSKRIGQRRHVSIIIIKRICVHTSVIREGKPTKTSNITSLSRVQQELNVDVIVEVEDDKYVEVDITMIVGKVHVLVYVNINT